jgi:hypothetical protein
VPNGAGGFPAGTGRAGFNPVASPSPSNVGIPPRATNYDPVTHDWTTTEGFYDAIHPVDQAVVLALMIEQGSLKSAPTVGQRYRKARRASGPAFDNEIEDLTRQALKRLTDTQKIKILAIEVDSKTRGQTKVQVSYMNLMTAKIVRQIVDTPINTA